MRCDGRTVVVKLGGSLITLKQKALTCRRRVVARLAEEIYEAWSSGVRLVLIHGGGSYGHYVAMHELKTKGALTTGSIPQIARTMRELNSIIVKELEKHGLPVVVFPPSSFCITDCTSYKVECNFTSVIKSFEAGHLPVLYGDITYPDGMCEPRIVSGDELALSLADIIRPDIVVFAMDVKGVLERKRSGKEWVISKVNLSRLEEIAKRLGKGSSGVYDVTGGIASKLELIERHLKRGLSSPVILTTGLLRGNLKRVLAGQGKYVGTLITRD
uniref:Isopentenyl phosphate kinase n=1 Tax=Fervidicoccus fontis TaxID=683846 RepID=A0A7J3ZLT0_9CREN